MSNDDHPLQPILSDLQEQVERLREDLAEIRGSLAKNKQVLEWGFKDLHDAIYDTSAADAELDLVRRVAGIRAIVPQVEAETERLVEEREEIDDRLEAISRRYEEKHAELDRTATDRVRDVGEHIFALFEDEFEDGIETPFVDAVPPTWEQLQAHTTRTVADRNARLRASFDRASAEMDDFLAHREGLVRHIADHRVSVPRSVEAPASLQIPYWVVTVERDGSEETVVVPPSMLEDTATGWFTARVDPIEGFEEPIDRLATDDSGRSHPATTTAADVTAAVEPYATERLGGTLSFTTAFDRAMEDIDLRVEGGDD